MRIIKRIALSIVLLLAVFVVFIVAVIFDGAMEEAGSNYQFSVNYSISDFNTEKQRADDVQKACEKYCASKTLKQMECIFKGYDNIIEKDGEIVYGFYELIDDSREGGNVSTAKVYYSTVSNKIYKIDTFGGPGKACDLGGKDLNPQMWTLSINEMVDLFVEQYTEAKLTEVSKPYLKITVNNDKAVCWLFSEDKKGYIEEVVYTLVKN